MLRTPRFLALSAALLASAVSGRIAAAEPGWRCDFSDPAELREHWGFRGARFRVPKTRFFIEKNGEASGGGVFVVEANKSTGLLVTLPSGVDLAKYPIMRWRWRIVSRIALAEDKADPDDQAAVVYFGDGSYVRQRCVGYRWECNTRVGETGKLNYVGGLMLVKWFCIRNREFPLNEWVTEEKDVVTDYHNAFGEIPKNYFAISVGANSQYTASDTRVEIDFIELVAREDATSKELASPPAPAAAPAGK